MDAKQQYLAWACLPKEVREKMSDYYRRLCSQKKEYIRLNFENARTKVQERMAVLEHFFGGHNLTSDKELEEMLMVKAEVVREVYNFNE